MANQMPMGNSYDKLLKQCKSVEPSPELNSWQICKGEDLASNRKDLIS